MFFRRVKIANYTKEGIEGRLRNAWKKVLSAADYDPTGLEEAVTTWAIWREALDRKTDNNPYLLDQASVPDYIPDLLRVCREIVDAESSSHSSTCADLIENGLSPLLDKLGV